MVSDHTVIEPGADGARGSNQNVGNIERGISGGVGAALLFAGLKRRSLPGLLFAALGGALAWRALSGRCQVYSALGLDTRSRPATRLTRRDRSKAAGVVDQAGAVDPVAEASADSFPASDAPGWTSTQI